MTSHMTGASLDTIGPEGGVCVCALPELFAAFTHNSAVVTERITRQGNRETANAKRSW